MCFDSDAPRSKRFCYYGTDDITCGKAVTAELAKVPEIVHAHGLSGQVDLLIRVACRDTQHLFDTDARILAIEGVPRSLEGGRVITEHDVLPGAWYLDGGRIPTCIAVASMRM